MGAKLKTVYIRGVEIESDMLSRTNIFFKVFVSGIQDCGFFQISLHAVKTTINIGYKMMGLDIR